MTTTSEDASVYVIRELQKELERQADLIYRLREDNVTLRTKLETERAVSAVYAEQLRQVQDSLPVQQIRAQSPIDKAPTLSTPAGDAFPELNNGAGLTIQTQLQTSASEGSWLDETDSMTYSEYEEQKRSSAESCPTDKLTWQQKRAMLFRKGKNKDRKRVSLRHFLVKPQRSDVTPPEETAETTTLARTKDNRDTKSVQKQQAGQDKESLSQMGWTATVIGQRFRQIKESYDQHKDVFEDDVRFIYEVLNGQSKAPEMDEEVELRNLMKDFKRWRKQFEASVKALQVTLKKQNNAPSFSIIYKIAAERACVRQKRQRTSMSDLP